MGWIPLHSGPDRNKPAGSKTGEFGRLLQFRPDRIRQRPQVPPVSETEPFDADFSHYERDGEKAQSERQRMLMNVIALAVVVFLVGTGVWLADSITAMQRDQDCVLQGRMNCAPLESPLPLPH